MCHVTEEAAGVAMAAGAMAAGAVGVVVAAGEVMEAAGVVAGAVAGVVIIITAGVADMAAGAAGVAGKTTKRSPHQVQPPLPEGRYDGALSHYLFVLCV